MTRNANLLLAVSPQCALGPGICSFTIVCTPASFGLPALMHSHLRLLRGQSPDGLLGRQCLSRIFCKCENSPFQKLFWREETASDCIVNSNAVSVQPLVLGKAQEACGLIEYGSKNCIQRVYLCSCFCHFWCLKSCCLHMFCFRCQCVLQGEGRTLHLYMSRWESQSGFFSLPNKNHWEYWSFSSFAGELFCVNYLLRIPALKNNNKEAKVE